MQYVGDNKVTAADNTDSSANEIYSQAKLEAIGGRSLPSPDQGASTISFTDKGDMDKQGLFPN